MSFFALLGGVLWFVLILVYLGTVFLMNGGELWKEMRDQFGFLPAAGIVLGILSGAAIVVVLITLLGLLLCAPFVELLVDPGFFSTLPF